MFCRSCTWETYIKGFENKRNLFHLHQTQKNISTVTGALKLLEIVLKPVRFQ